MSKRLSLGLAGYFVLLAASHLWSSRNGEEPAQALFASIEHGRIRIAYSDSGGDGPAVLAIHGSPGDGRSFGPLEGRLKADYRVIAPDLPGFGRSTRELGDYSIRAQAKRLADFMETLQIPSYHVVGHSLGGGVALHLADLAPDRVRSVALISSIGVQETELTGDYAINHALHGVQLRAIEAANLLLPHFGLLDRIPFDEGYARSFYDSDQRPLRPILTSLTQPLLIVHGRKDVLAPEETAFASHRLAKHSSLVLLDDDHFFLFRPSEAFVGPLAAFLAGKSVRSDEAPAATETFPLMGPALLLAAALLAAMTFVSEDLACVAAGLLIAHGRMSFVVGAGACYVGILLGDLGLFAVGRSLGKWPWLKRQMRRRVASGDVEAAAEWLLKRRAIAVFVSRFTPGLRLPTYLAAGALGVAPLSFAALFALAVAVWTPLLVGGGALLGTATLRMSPGYWALGVAAVVLFSVRPRVKLWKTWRRMVGRCRRWSRWEFWPAWAAYVPVAAYIAVLAARWRSLTLFTAANPAFDGAGGLVGESKIQILRMLERAGAPVARFRVVRAGAAEAVELPVVVKPDAGERGRGVTIVRSKEELRERLEGVEEELILQDYVGGLEFGIFYYRFPGEAAGRILSITSKTFPEVVGDGKRTLEGLVLADKRAVCLADVYLKSSKLPRDLVLPAGQRHRLVEIGSHCRGSVFLDATHLATPSLLAKLDAISHATPGFFFGRYDVRVPSEELLARGEGFRILELNGVSSESVNIYDPRVSILEAYGTLFTQWRTAFEIGARNRAAGAKPATLLEVIQLVLGRRKAGRSGQTRTFQATEAELG